MWAGAGVAGRARRRAGWSRTPAAEEPPAPAAASPTCATAALRLQRVRRLRQPGSGRGDRQRGTTAASPSRTRSSPATASTGRGGIVFAKGAGGGASSFRRTRRPLDDRAGGGGASTPRSQPGDRGCTVEDSRSHGRARTRRDGGAIYVEGGPLVIDAFEPPGQLGAPRRCRVPEGRDAHRLELDLLSGTGARVAARQRAGTRGATSSSRARHRGRSATRRSAEQQRRRGGGAFAGDGPSPLVLRASLLEWNSTRHAGRSALLLVRARLRRVQHPEPGRAGRLPTARPASCATARVSASFRPRFGASSFRLARRTARAIDLVTSGCPPPAIDQRGLARPQAARLRRGLVRMGAERHRLGGRDHTRATRGPTSLTLRRAPVGGRRRETVTVAYATADEDGDAGARLRRRERSLDVPSGRHRAHRAGRRAGRRDRGASWSASGCTSAPHGARARCRRAEFGRIKDDDTAAGDPRRAAATCSRAVSPVSSRAYALSNYQRRAGDGAVRERRTAPPPPGVDYQSAAGTLTFAPGVVERGRSGAHRRRHSSTRRPRRSLFALCGAPRTEPSATALAIGMIRDNDGPRIAIGDGGRRRGHRRAARRLP